MLKTQSQEPTDRPVGASRGKFILIGCAALAVWLFGDTLFHGALFVVHAVIEVLESLFDEFFVHVLGLSHRQAEIATAYNSLFIGLFVVYKLMSKAYRRARRLATLWHARYRRFAVNRKGILLKHWRVVAASLGAATLALWFSF